MKSGAGLVELRDSGYLLEERAGGIKNSLRNSLFVREINNQGGCSATPWHTELQLGGEDQQAWNKSALHGNSRRPAAFVQLR